MSKPLPPGPKGSLFTGVLRDYQRDPLGFFTACARDYGDFVPMRFGPLPAFLFSHPDLIDQVLVTQSRSFIKGPALRNNRLVFGNGLLTSEGDFWRKQRKLAQPAFHRERVAAYADIMAECTRRRMANWQDGETLDIHEELMLITMDIAAQTLFSTEVEGAGGEVAACLRVLQVVAMRRFQSLINLPEWVPTPMHLRLQHAVKKLERIVYGFINERRQSGEDRGDLLSALLQAQDEDGTRMTDRQLRDEVLTLFLAGHETTALALTWTLMLLAQNPEAEEKLAEEVQTVLQGRRPTMEDRAALTYTEHVVLEGMRLYPPAWAAVRTAIEDTEIGGCTIPKGALVLALQWVVHRDPRWFPDPERFDPGRWQNDLVRRLPRHAYFPFGGGPRICIGNVFAMTEATILLATLVQRYHFRVVPDPPVILQPAITLRPLHGLQVTLCRR